MWVVHAMIASGVGGAAYAIVGAFGLPMLVCLAWGATAGIAMMLALSLR